MAKVLIVEDESLIARMYKKALDFEGFEVVIADGGADGIKKAETFKPDLILLDIMMPEPNGIEVLEKIKSNENLKNIIVVVLTNLSGENDAQLALKKGADEYWVKSEIDVKKLPEKIEQVLAINSS